MPKHWRQRNFDVGFTRNVTKYYTTKTVLDDKVMAALKPHVTKEQALSNL
ncbi:hypothetical protein HQN88_20010 [Paenibacillus qinlingensis]|nr:hypothetical protein [Paenibacillus qinlingensis]